MINGMKRPLVVAFVALSIVVTVGLVNYWGHFHGEILGFFRIGTVIPHSPYLGDVPKHVLSEGELGYDGQFFLAIALDPGLQQGGSVAALDNPRYRYRRIFYPFLASLISLGYKPAVPYALVGINGACLVGIVFVVALWFQESGLSPWLGLLALGIVGVWIVFFLSTADLLASFLLIISLYAYFHCRVWITALAMAAAGLTHETLLLVLGGFWFGALLKRNWRDLLILALAILPAGVWNIHVLKALPVHGSTTGFFENFTLPAEGAVTKIRVFLMDPLSVKAMYDGFTFFLITGMLVLLCFGPKQSDQGRVLRWCGVVYLILYLLVSMQVFEYYLGFNRVFMNVGLLLLMGLADPSWRSVKVGILGLSSVASLFFVIAYTLGLI